MPATLRCWARTGASNWPIAGAISAEILSIWAKALPAGRAGPGNGSSGSIGSLPAMASGARLGSKSRPEPLAALEAEVRRQVQEMKEVLDRELAGGAVGCGSRQKILQSMRRHWQGLTVFVDHPHVPMDNNAAERANRPLAVARKNFYGSGAQWSGELACACFTILATLRQHQICPRRYFQAYFEACARQGGRVPARTGRVPALEMERGATGRLDHPGASAMSAAGRTALLRARVQRGGPGAYPAALGAPARPGPGGLVAPGVPGLGLAQCLGPAQRDECAGGPAADGAGWFDPIARAPQSQWPRPAPLPTHGGFRPPSAGPSPAASSGAAASSSGCPAGRLSRLWNELIARYHYLGYRPLSGAQMRYLVWSADGRLLAALGFGASAWQVQPRDRYIGWNDRQRRAGLHRIVNNARFLILPWVQCHGLASRILSGILKPLRADWRCALRIPTGVAGNLRGNPALYRHFLPGGQLDPARTDSGAGQIGKAALSNRSTQGYLGLPVAPQLSANPLRRILSPCPEAGSPNLYPNDHVADSQVSAGQEVRPEGFKCYPRCV